MPANSPAVGTQHLTVTGTPVQVLEVHQDAVVLQGLASDNRIRVPASYPLQPFDPNKAAWQTRPRPYSPRSRKTGTVTNPAQAKPLAPLIDAMLLAGNMTMRGILRELRRKASAACRGKDLKANVRARLYWFRKRGRRVDRDRQGCLRVEQVLRATS
jgi:hypothetical protein